MFNASPKRQYYYDNCFTENIDYGIPDMVNVTFFASIITASFNIVIIDDHIKESSETFYVTIIEDLLPPNVGTGANSTIEVTISDDDESKCIIIIYPAQHFV